ncbi:uncharacterized protein N7511_004833 [Penicillium nucicola]|uniref:uncharacterized protein n=1 Tax=Penicillium nucicola TaxID=1850975 RepID=UPI002544D443|nr:uncharacterized protein N7511_004833 [Penicillium nucicola]KAJ5767217.1 hypothetical protein N7511_004833 [Penicillium nucicola]
MQDYLDYIYPMVPVVHRPSFRKALREDQDSENDSCFALMVSIAALVVATMPSRFQAYQSEILSSRFSSRKEFVHFCYAKCVGMRTSSYFDELGFQKFAVSMLSVEAMQIARLLNLHRISEYEGLNLIETQLRKKGFWLMFYSFVHAHLQNLLGERLTYLDPTLLCSINPEDLMPLDVEDEFIFEYEVLTPTSNKPCLVTGFILHSRVFWAAIRSLRPDPTMDEPCPCVRAKNPDMEVVYYQNRFHGLKSVIENIPPSLQQAWTPNDEEINSGDTSDAEGSMSPLQFSSIRANLHVTHLWLQSLILDQLDAAQSHRQRQFAAGGLDQETADLDQRALWMERENICRQLFFILFNFPPLSLDANGLHLVNKVRDITASLLACPFHPADPLSKQAAQYIQHSTEILSRLDRSEGMNTMHLQTWVDTDRLWR